MDRDNYIWFDLDHRVNGGKRDVQKFWSALLKL